MKKLSNDERFSKLLALIEGNCTTEHSKGVLILAGYTVQMEFSRGYSNVTFRDSDGFYRPATFAPPMLYTAILAKMSEYLEWIKANPLKDC